MKLYNLYNERACPQTIFKILRLQRQRCQIKGTTGLPKTWGARERERAENKNPGGGGRRGERRGGGHLRRVAQLVYYVL